MNVLWIAIRERTREIGTLRAIGMQRRRVLVMFLDEAFLLGARRHRRRRVLGLVVVRAAQRRALTVPPALQMFLMPSTCCSSDVGWCRDLRGAVHHRLHHADLAHSLLPRRAAQAGDGDAPHRVNHAHERSTPRSRAALAAGARCAAPTPSHRSRDGRSCCEAIDDRQRNGGDYKALVYLEQKEKDKADIVREALVYRRDADDKLMILFTKPKSEAGKGYLRLDKNLWSYDPNVGKWERTHRARAHRRHRLAPRGLRRVAPGRGVRRQATRAKRSSASSTVHKLKLKAKAGVDVAYPGRQAVGRQGHAATSSSARSSRSRAG